MLPVAVPLSDKAHYDALARQLSLCLDTAPDGCDRPQMKNARDEDRLAAVLVPLIWRNSGWQILMTKRAAHLSCPCVFTQSGEDLKNGQGETIMCPLVAPLG